MVRRAANVEPTGGRIVSRPTIIRRVRRVGYPTLKYLGDAEAGEKAIRTGSAKPIIDRLERRVLGRLAGQIIRALVK
jgi:hypothetical protein